MKALALWFLLALTAHAEPLWVAVGDDGLRMSSRDGLEWKAPLSSMGESDAFNAVVYGHGRFLATRCRVDAEAAAGTMFLAWSSDGLIWKHAAPAALPADRLLFGKGRFVAIRGLGLSVSERGESFAAPAQKSATAEFCTAAAAGDTEAGFRVVALGRAGNGASGGETWRAVSTNAAKWDVIERGARAGSLAYGAGHFVIVGADGQVETSHDGQTWVIGRTLSGGPFSDFLWSGKRFIARGRQTWSSPDGFEWYAESSAFPGALLWVRDGIGALCRAEDGAIVFSRDGASWRETSLPKAPRVNAIAFRDE